MPFVSDLTREDLKRVLKEYGLHELSSFREFPLGIENANIRVKTEKGEFVLREWMGANSKNIAFELSLMEALRKKGLPVAKTFRTRSGKELLEFGGKRFALLEFMPGQYVKNSELNSRQLWEIGRALAEMQLALKGFKPRGESRARDLFHFEQEYGILKNAFPIVDKETQKLLKELKKKPEN